MYYSLRGTLIAADGRSAAVECGGVGYLCTVSAQTYSQLPEPGEEVLLYTHLSVREDAMELYGFSTQVERSCFRMLTQPSSLPDRCRLRCRQSWARAAGARQWQPWQPWVTARLRRHPLFRTAPIA